MPQSTNQLADSPFLAVFNNSGVDIPVGRIVIVDTTGDFFVTLPADAAAHNTFVPLGVTTEKLYAGTWGRIATRAGAVLAVTSGAAVARGNSVTCSSVAGANKGKAIVATAGGNTLGVALTAAAGADTDIKVLVDRARNALD